MQIYLRNSNTGITVKKQTLHTVYDLSNLLELMDPIEGRVQRAGVQSEDYLTVRKPNQSTLKEINSEYSLEDWRWNSNTLATWCKELTHWKRPWCWERLKAGGEGDDREQDGWMASPTRWTWVWASSRSWWWTEKPGVLQSMGLQRVRHNWVTEQQQTTPGKVDKVRPVVLAWAKYILLQLKSFPCSTWRI